VVLFFPSFLYRINIKATCWFWWPLALLLKPVPLADEESQRKQALCWPWTNPFQKIVIGGSVLLVLFSLVLHNIRLGAWMDLGKVAALPGALKVLLAVDWGNYKPWHWAQWIIAVSGLGMLVIAGNARSHVVNGNWETFSQRWPSHIRRMTGLSRIRSLATIILLMMALGALSLANRSWLNWVPVPERWIHAMEKFYEV
jgi:hypothetical protein